MSWNFLSKMERKCNGAGMKLKGVHHVEFSVLEYEESIKFYDKMFGWLGYKSFWTLDIGYRSTYYVTSFFFFHSYIGIQPAKTGGKLQHNDHETGIHHVALWARSRKQVDEFYENFLRKNNVHVSETPAEYPVYAPGYYAVFFDDPITGIHWELAYTPLLPSISSYLKWKRALKVAAQQRPEWKNIDDPLKAALRKLPTRREQ